MVNLVKGDDRDLDTLVRKYPSYRIFFNEQSINKSFTMPKDKFLYLTTWREPLERFLSDLLFERKRAKQSMQFEDVAQDFINFTSRGACKNYMAQRLTGLTDSVPQAELMLAALKRLDNFFLVIPSHMLKDGLVLLNHLLRHPSSPTRLRSNTGALADGYKLDLIRAHASHVNTFFEQNHVDQFLYSVIVEKFTDLVGELHERQVEAAKQRSSQKARNATPGPAPSKASRPSVKHLYEQIAWQLGARHPSRGHKPAH